MKLASDKEKSASTVLTNFYDCEVNVIDCANEPGSF